MRENTLKHVKQEVCFVASLTLEAKRKKFAIAFSASRRQRRTRAEVFFGSLKRETK